MNPSALRPAETQDGGPRGLTPLDALFAIVASEGLESGFPTCYTDEAMPKSLKAASRTYVVKVATAGKTVLYNAETGQSVTVKGVGALKGSHLKIKKGVSLLKPIAKQALVRRSEKHKTARQHAEKRKAG